jgi:hypothetical protein
MEFMLEIRFDDKNYNAIIHFMSPFSAKSESDAKLFVDELVHGFKRKGALVLSGVSHSLDNDPELMERQYEYYEFFKSRATAKVKIEQFALDNPDQVKSLADNLTEKLFTGKDSTALVGKRYNIPVWVIDKTTRNTIDSEIFYYTVEHLILKK